MRTIFSPWRRRAPRSNSSATCAPYSLWSCPEDVYKRQEGSKVSVTAKVIYLNAQDQPTQGLLIQVRQQDMTNSNRDFAYYQGITIAAPAGTVKARIEFDVSTDGGQSMDLDDVSFSLA